MIPPRATMRLQFNSGFTLDDAVPLVDYFARLGISHVYASPIMTARPGSTHGYDITDPTRVNPELGGEDALRRLMAALRAREMGLILDIVPNHMGVGKQNAWWMDVLKNGPQSRYAKFFDFDWNTSNPTLQGKMLAPFLGVPYGEALASGDLRLIWEDESSEFYILYFDNPFPIRPSDQAELSAENVDAVLNRFNGDNRAPLHQLLEKQNYRLAWWRTAADEINWRRFFDIGELAAIRVEEPEVFEATHELIFRLYTEGLIDGLRVDHVDGLADPAEYCRQVRERLSKLEPQRPAEARRHRPMLLVEKILAPAEQLPDDWGVDGTTGYDFMNEVSSILHDPAGAQPLLDLWHEVTETERTFAEEVRGARQQILLQNFESELSATAHAFHAIARSSLATRDTTLRAIRRVLIELLVAFPVYRTYTDGTRRSESDSMIMGAAAAAARLHIAAHEQPVLDLIDMWLGGAEDADPAAADLRQNAAARFQQLTSPLAAKAVEDTVAYRYAPLLSRNEVGAEAEVFATSVEEFHESCGERARSFPRALLATATHDHKRGADVRVRLAVLSEMPEEWGGLVRRWRELNAAARSDSSSGFAPSAADEMMLYQTILGMWPLDADDNSDERLDQLLDRLADWQVKAAREAKMRSSWAFPDEEYEAHVTDFMRRIMTSSPQFRGEFESFVRRLAPAGALNSLSQTVLHLTTPGIPDIYQGTEFWDLSLVDPDNRRPVDFAARKAALERDDHKSELLVNWQDGAIKFAMLADMLALREREPDLFAEGSYEPLEVAGSLADHVIAFRRAHAQRAVVVVVSRLAARLLTEGLPLVPPEAWNDTEVCLRQGAEAFRNIFTGQAVAAENDRLPLRDVLTKLPVAVLEQT